MKVGQYKTMTELFRSLVEMDLPLMEEDKVVYLLASLPDLFGVLVTALEASPDVPTMDVVTEHLLHQERKLNDCAGAVDEKALIMKASTLRRRGHVTTVASSATISENAGRWLLRRGSNLRRRARMVNIRPA